VSKDDGVFNVEGFHDNGTAKSYLSVTGAIEEVTRKTVAWEEQLAIKNSSLKDVFQRFKKSGEDRLSLDYGPEHLQAPLNGSRPARGASRAED
jgi:hypothetical protein